MVPIQHTLIGLKFHENTSGSLSYFTPAYVHVEEQPCAQKRIYYLSIYHHALVSVVESAKVANAT